MNMWRRMLAVLAAGFVAASALDAWLVARAAAEPGFALTLWLVAAHAAVAIVTGLAAWWLRRWALRPLGDLQAQVIELGQGRFNERRQPAVPEWQPLAKELNVAASRLQLLFREHHQKIGNLLEHVNQDPVTLLASRVHFIERLQAGLAEGDDAAAGIVLIVRVDDLAGFNQRAGRSRGDDLLRAVAVLLRLRVAALAVDGVSVARLNGADFAVLAPAIDANRFQPWLAELARAVDGLRADLLTDRPYAAWLGATTYTPGETPSEVMARADAMLQTCETTRTPWRLTTQSNPLHAMTMAEWRLLIEDALEGGRITMGMFEVRSRSGETLHLEASVRLRLPDGRRLRGADIIPPAIRTGRTVDIDLRIVLLALEHIRRSGIPVSVNLAPASVVRPAFVSRLRVMLASAGGSAAKLSLEVDESILRENRPALAALAGMLVPFGTRLGIDHLFERLSDIPGLGAMPLHYLKLDGRVLGLNDGPGARQYLDLCVALGHAEGLLVIATGIADDAALSRIGVANVDGCTGPAVRRLQLAPDHAPAPDTIV